jgi:hypothetical protein
MTSALFKWYCHAASTSLVSSHDFAFAKDTGKICAAMSDVRHAYVGGFGLFAQSANQVGALHPTSIALPNRLDEVGRRRTGSDSPYT